MVAIRQFLERLADLLGQQLFDAVWPATIEQRCRRGQLVQRRVARGDDEIRWRDVRIHFEGVIKPTGKLLRLQSRGFAERERVFIDEALSRQRADEFETVAGDSLGAVVDGALEQPAADCREQALKFNVEHRFGLQQRPQQRLRGERARALRAEEFAQRQLSRPNGREALQHRCDCGALLDERLGAGEPQRQRLGVMLDGGVAAPERLIGQGDGVVRGRVGGIHGERLAEEFERRSVAALLLGHVAEQNQAAHVVGLALQNRATQRLRRRELGAAEMGCRRGVEILDP